MGEDTSKRTVVRRKLRSIPPGTAMRDRTGGESSLADLPERLEELKKRLQYVAQEVQKARERGEDVTPEIETGGNVNIGGYELNLGKLTEALSSGEGSGGLENALDSLGLGGLLKGLLGNLDLGELLAKAGEYAESSGHEGSGKEPVVRTEITIRELGEHPKEWTGLSGPGAGTVQKEYAGSGTTGSLYNKGENASRGRASSPAPRGSGGGVGSIARRGSQGTGSTGQKIVKTGRAAPVGVGQPPHPSGGMGLEDAMGSEVDYDIFQTGDKRYEVIVSGLVTEAVDSVQYDREKSSLVVNGEVEILLEGYRLEKVLDWEYKNGILTIGVEEG